MFSSKKKGSFFSLRLILKTSLQTFRRLFPPTFNCNKESLNLKHTSFQLQKLQQLCMYTALQAYRGKKLQPLINHTQLSSDKNGISVWKTRKANLRQHFQFSLWTCLILEYHIHTHCIYLFYLFIFLICCHLLFLPAAALNAWYSHEDIYRHKETKLVTNKKKSSSYIMRGSTMNQRKPCPIVFRILRKSEQKVTQTLPIQY